MSFEDKIWYQKLSVSSLPVIILLFPFSILFWAVSSLRRFLYRRGFLKKTKVNIPVIVAGGISVGGTGKTPLCIALINSLSKAGFKVGLLSRGYRGKSDSYPLIVTKASDYRHTGDEPLLIRLSAIEDAVVVVDPNRERGARYLEKLGVDLIITDDGLQHYSLCRDIEIVVIDGKRKLGNGLLLPAGPLREGKWHLKSADFTVINGISDNNQYYSMNLIPNNAVSLESFFNKKARHDYLQKGCTVAVLAGIGNPARVYHTVEQCGYHIGQKLSVLDHREISLNVLREISQKMPVIMTAKDAVKYADCNIGNLFVLGVEAHLPDTFYQKLIEKIHALKNSNREAHKSN